MSKIKEASVPEIDERIKTIERLMYKLRRYDHVVPRNMELELLGLRRLRTYVLLGERLASLSLSMQDESKRRDH